MDRLNEPKSILGDTIGYLSPRYEQIPDEYGFDSVQPSAIRCPLTARKWDELIDFAKRYYAKFEVVGETYVDFANNLQLFYDKGSDTFERLLEVYDDDIAKPILGRTEKVTYDEQTTNNGSSVSNGTDSTDSNITDNNTTTNNLTTSVNSSSQTDNIDVPVDSSNPNTQVPSSVVKDSGNSTTSNTGTVKFESSHIDKTTVTRNGNTTDNATAKHTGSVTTELSDLGVRPNYESLNGFLDNNRTYYDVFVWLFRDCFAINDYLIW